MNDPEQLQAIDRRGALASSDLHTRASARPVPAFDPAAATTLPAPRSLADRRSKRPLYAVAAAFLLVAGAAGALAVRHDDGNDQAGVSTAPARPFEATRLPDGMAVVGAFEVADAAPDPTGENGPVPFDVYGPAADEPGLGVAVTRGIDEAGFADGPPVPLGDGRVAHEVVGFGLAGTVLVVDVGQDQALMLSNVLTKDQLATVAAGVTIDGGRAVLVGGTPEGWRRLGTEPDLLNAQSPLSTTRQGGIGAQSSIIYGADAGDGTEPTAYAAVSSTEGDEIRLNVSRLLLVKVREIEVQGHPALIGEAPALEGQESHPVRTIAWLEPRGELIRVSAMGVSEDDLRAMAESVRPVAPEAWDELLLQSKRGDLAGPSGGPGTPIGEGTFADGTPWVLRAFDSRTSTPYEPGSGASPTLELRVVLDESAHSSSSGSSSSGSSGGGSTDEPAGQDAFDGLNTLEQGGRHFLYGLLLRPDVAKVEVRRSDGTVLTTATVVDGQGVRAWVAELTEAQADVVALDGAGSPLGTVSVSDDGNSQTYETEGTEITIPSGD